MYLEVYETLKQNANELSEVPAFQAAAEAYFQKIEQLSTLMKQLDELNQNDEVPENSNADIVVTIEDFERIWGEREKKGDAANELIASINGTIGELEDQVKLMDGLVEKFEKLSPRFLEAYKAARVLKAKDKDGKGTDPTTGK